MKTISSTELLKDTPLAKDMRHNPYGKMETIKTQVGSATYRKLIPNPSEKYIDENTILSTAERINRELGFNEIDADSTWTSAQMLQRLFKKSLLRASERSQIAMLMSGGLNIGMTSDDYIIELGTGAGGALKMLLSGIYGYNLDTSIVPKPTIISVDYSRNAQALVAMRMATLGQEVLVTEGLPAFDAYKNKIVLARADFLDIAQYPENYAKFIYSDNGIIYVKQDGTDSYEDMIARFTERLNCVYDRLIDGGTFAMSFLNIGFTRRATFADMPNVERVEAIKQILNPDYFAQLKMILWAIKGNGEDLRAELLNLIPFTMDEVKDIFSKSKFKGITQSYSTLAGMINVCVAKKEK